MKVEPSASINLQDQQATFGTLNTPKGRVYLIFLIVRIEDHFLLRAHEETIEPDRANDGTYRDVIQL